MKRVPFRVLLASELTCPFGRVFPHTVCSANHECTLSCFAFALAFQQHAIGCTIAILSDVRGRTHMQMAITFMAVVAGLVFSIAVALVVEELIFGQVFRLFFTPPQPAQAKAVQQR